MNWEMPALSQAWNTSSPRKGHSDDFGFWGQKNKIDVSCDLGLLLWFKCENIPPQSQVLK